jgi:hypothetical protein
VLRSRGASRGLVLRTMTVQSVGVGVLALVGGPLLAILLVRAVGQLTLPAADQGVLSLLSGSPLDLAWSVRWFALPTAICAVAAMVFSTRRAANTNILALRRESARTTRRPLWQRLNLDLIFAVVAVFGYSAYTYIVSRVNSFARPFLSVLSLFAVLFLMLAIAMLFLRFFPQLLRLLARFASRGATAAPMLAIGQMARSPRQASRMTLLLALSTAFALFALIFSASQAQRVRDVATYQTGADFRGNVDPHDAGLAGYQELAHAYGAIPGVISATPVYDLNDIYAANDVGIPLELLAVDADTFARTALWSPQDASQSLASLMAQLAAGRQSAGNAVPALVDAETWQALHLTPGATFTLQLLQSDDRPTRFRAVAQVAHIPPLNDGEDVTSGFGNGSAGLLVDFATLNAVYAQTQAGGNAGHGLAVTPGQIWLRTADDAAALASVRAALTTGPLQVTNLLDRRQLIATAESDALHVDLLSVLALGAGTALLLALVGILLGSWLSARSRLTSFALLRALGSEPRQLASVLLWEQGIVYGLALGLGTGIGFVLAAAVLPAIIFTNSGRFEQIINTLEVPPIQTVIPWPAVGAVLGALLVLCTGAILLMTWMVARPSISQTLRLNED